MNDIWVQMTAFKGEKAQGVEVHLKILAEMGYNCFRDESKRAHMSRGNRHPANSFHIPSSFGTLLNKSEAPKNVLKTDRRQHCGPANAFFFLTQRASDLIAVLNPPSCGRPRHRIALDWHVTV